MRREILRLTRYARFPLESVMAMSRSERRSWNLALSALFEAEGEAGRTEDH